MASLKRKPRAIVHYENIIYTWLPDYDTENSLELFPNSVLGDDEDIVRPHSKLYFKDSKGRNLQIEPSADSHDESYSVMSRRVERLLKYNYTLQQTSGVNKSQHLECRLCRLRFDRPKEVVNHLGSGAHMCEVRRLDYWFP